ncbi:hypothetical protein C9374_006005 [Naegleria lovaniensis]|uniref:Ankyrin repeat protein n=1 Tax=Naegleria lovaniensis TaxID=51637 RepID=A0AA88KMM4_NAELO|nr:uncharacterized protein C9374_006005 [Naegleria lovaniensis]KAG2381621.1 hypothetical protein C9374_006005 [Naegleria lovaniensis]
MSTKKAPSTTPQRKKIQLKVDENNTPESVLVEYIRVGQTEDIEQLFKDYLIDPNFPIYDKSTSTTNDAEKVVVDYPFTLAARNRFNDVVQVLVKNKANINCKINGDNVLHIAVSNNDESFLRAMLEVEVVHPTKKEIVKKIDIDGRNDKNLRPIDIAINNNSTTLIKILLEHGAEFEFDEPLEHSNHTLLHTSAIEGDVKRLACLLELGQSPYKKDMTTGRNILHFAVLNNRKEFVEYYLKMKLDVSLLYSTDLNGQTPIHECCNLENWEMLKLFMTKFNFDINYLFPDGLSLLHRFAFMKKQDLCDKLVGLKAKINNLDKFGNTPLHWACSSGSISLTTYFLEKKLSSNDQNCVGNSCLHVSCYHGFVDITELLLADKKIQINILNKDHRSPLMEAVSRGHLKIVEILLSKGANIHEEDNKGMTSLQIALNEKQEEIALLLVKKGAKVDRKYVGYAREDSLNDREYMIQNRVVESNEQSMEKLRKSDLGFNTILQQAIVLGFSGLVDEMVKLPECPLEGPDANGVKPLTNAIKVQNIKMVRSLTGTGKVDVATIDPITGFSPLILACSLGNYEICAHLVLECKVSTNSCEPATNKTALHYACRVGNLEMVKLLVDNGSRVDDVDHHHRTPLFEACEHNHGDIVEYLIEKQANVEHKDDEGHTCLHTCCKHGSVACMTSLIARGAVLNSKDLAGRTPLIVASQFGQTECGRVLVKAFASMKKH